MKLTRRVDLVLEAFLGLNVDGLEGGLQVDVSVPASHRCRARARTMLTGCEDRE
jgi:hypothetical protein